VQDTDKNEKLLAMPPLAVDTEAGLARFAALAQGIRPTRRAMPRFMLGAPRLLAAAAAIVIVATTLTMTGLADSIFQIFEAKQFAAVSVTPTDLKTLDQLSEFGTLTWSGQPQPHMVASLAQASAETGLPGITVTIPASVKAGSSSPKYGAMTKTTATFVFNASKARDSAAAAGRTPPPMPAKLDGSTLVLTGGPAIVLSYADASHPDGGVFVGVAKAPTVGSDGATVAEIQGYLLSQPTVSPALAAQIRAMGDPASTLPVPIPVGQAAAKNVGVHGTTGLFVGDSTGLGSGVLWQQNGLVYIVAGTLTEAETLAIANSLK
jgi:hypothetical protein